MQESIGGTINKININGGETHYFNIINEDVIDLTKEQFKNRNIKVQYYPNEEVKRDEILDNDNTRERYIILKERAEKLRREEYMKDNY